MRTFRLLIVCGCLAALVVVDAGPQPSAQSHADPTFESLATLVTAKMHEYRIPGVALGVLRDGQTTIRGFGVRNVNDPQPVTSNTVFPLASISKTVTTTAVMRLVEQGKIDLHAPVRKYLPDFRVADEAASREVTIWHLVTHTSGWEGQLSATDKGDETLARFVAGLSIDMQLAPPGAAWSYNNAGFAVAGRVIEVVTGQTFSDAIDDLVFRPLGLKLAFTRVGDVVAHWPAIGHVVGPDGSPGMQRTFTLGSTLPAGGVAMSMDNLLEYARFHLGDGRGADGAQMLKRATLDEMKKPQLRKQGYDEDIGLAWHLRTVGTVRTAAHGGTFSGHILLLELVPEKNFAIAILTNSGNGWRLIQDVEREALRAYHGASIAMNQAIGHRGLNETLPAVTPLAKQPDPTPYVGTYERPMNTVDVRAAAAGLIVQVRPHSRAADEPMPVLFYGPDRAVVTSGPERNASIEFIRDAAGAVRWVRVTGRIARRVAGSAYRGREPFPLRRDFHRGVGNRFAKRFPTPCGKLPALIVQARPRSRTADEPMPVMFYRPDRAVVTSGPERNAHHRTDCQAGCGYLYRGREPFSAAEGAGTVSADARLPHGVGNRFAKRFPTLCGKRPAL